MLLITRQQVQVQQSRPYAVAAVYKRHELFGTFLRNIKERKNKLNISLSTHYIRIYCLVNVFCGLKQGHRLCVGGDMATLIVGLESEKMCVGENVCGRKAYLSEFVEFASSFTPSTIRMSLSSDLGFELLN